MSRITPSSKAALPSQNPLISRQRERHLLKPEPIWRRSFGVDFSIFTRMYSTLEEVPDPNGKR